MDEIKRILIELRDEIESLRHELATRPHAGTWYLLGPGATIEDGDEILEPGAERKWRSAQWSVGGTVGLRIARRIAR